jgi:phosphoadenosine phosphosulfate reductase
MTDDLRRKVDRAVKLIQAAGKMAKEHGQPLEICYSGGKDSDVILELARMSGADIRPIYKNTTIDPPGTIKHAMDNGVEMARPKMTFKQIIEKRGIPGRLRRFCCEVLKEYKISDYAVVGVRRDESTARAERYHEPEQCRVYNNKEKARLYYPLLDFTAQDIADFIEWRGIKCHPLYYDEHGNFHVERRLGCMGCPLVTPKQRIKEFKEHPGMVKLYVHAAQKFFDNHPQSKMRAYIDNAAEWFVMSIYCKSVADFKQRFKADNLFGERIDCKAFLEKEFGIDL